MRTYFYAAMLATTITCASASGAIAYQFTFSGAVTSATTGNNDAIAGLTGQAIQIIVSGPDADGNGIPTYTIGATETTFGPSSMQAVITIGSRKGIASAVIPFGSSITNDGVTSSIDFSFGDTFGSFDTIQGGDSTFRLDGTSPKPNIPLDFANGFGPIGITGSGSYFAVPDASRNVPLPGFNIAFTLDTLRGSGSVSAVPLPGALPTFAAALLSLGAVGYGLRRRGGSDSLRSA